jgi:hypothetical protein
MLISSYGFQKVYTVILKMPSIKESMYYIYLFQ